MNKDARKDALREMRDAVREDEAAVRAAATPEERDMAFRRLHQDYVELTDAAVSIPRGTRSRPRTTDSAADVM